MQVTEALYFAKDELERNHACVQGGGAEVRRRNIQAMPTAIPRLGELGLLGFAKRFPGATERLLGNEIAEAGLQYVGGGSENTTVTNGVVVTKIFRKSTRWAEADRLEKAKRIGKDHELLREYLGDFTIPQVVTGGLQSD